MEQRLSISRDLSGADVDNRTQEATARHAPIRSYQSSTSDLKREQIVHESFGLCNFEITISEA